MLRFLPKFLLVATAFAPVMLTMAILGFSKGDRLSSWGFVAGTIVAVATCLGVLSLAKRRLPRHPVKVKSVKPADKELIGFVLAYLLPLARGGSFDGVAFFVVLGVFFFVVMTSNAYHTNPLLGLLGYHFYEATIEEVGYILVSKQHLHNTQAIAMVVNITDYMLLDATDLKEK